MDSQYVPSPLVDDVNEHSQISNLTQSTTQSDQESLNLQEALFQPYREILTDQTVDRYYECCNVSLSPNLSNTLSQAPIQELQQHECIELTAHTENIDNLSLLNSAVEHIEIKSLSDKGKLLSDKIFYNTD